MPEGKPFTFEAEVTSNPNQARAEGDRLADAFGRAMRESLVDVADALTKTLSKTFKEIFDPAQIQRTAAAMDDVTAATRRTEKANEALLADVKALQDRTEGFRDTLSKAGANPKLFAVVENQIARILKLERELESDINRFGTGSRAAARIGAEFQDISNIIRAEVSGIRGTLDSFTTAERRASVATTDALNRESVERRQIRQQEHGRNIAALQGANAKELKEIAGANQRALVSHRAASKARIEILQFTLRQIRVLERSIGRVFEGTAAVISGSFARIANTTKRIAPIFRAQNSALTQGLQPALLSRERSISRSFNSQEAVIRGSAARQAATLQQLNAQASRGVVGAATGRSAIGGLLGGGLAFGGVFALITKLKAGFTETVNLNEALNKTTQIFGAATAEIQAFADNSVAALFVTKSEALAAAANFGIFGKAAGLSGTELAKFSKDLTLLATDLASFNNTSIEDATTALAAALRGESEPIRKYGVLLNEAVLQNRALSLGIIDTTRKLQPFERVLAANAEIFAQTAVQQGDAARTADDFANSSRRARAASVEFFAAIARVAVPLATIITNGLFPAFQNMTKFILNDVGPALQVVRQAAIGAAAGIGALLIAKTAGEALRFLATSLKFVLTPMGALVLAVAAIGAAINILVNRSPELRRIFDDIRESIGDRLRQGLELAESALDRIGRIITETVLPAAIELAAEVRDRLLQAFRATVGFMRDTVIPAFERFGTFIRDEVLPAVDRFIERMRDRLAPILEAVSGFIQPAIDAFGRLGGAIRDVFTGVGGFSEVLDAIEGFGVRGAIIAGAAGLAIAAAFVNPLAGIAVAVAGLGVAFGPQLFEAIRPQLERFRDLLTETFSTANLEQFAVGFLRVVRRVGEIIGTIVSDPRFIAALAAIVAAAATTAGAFIVGFAEGINNNIPELTRIVGSAFLKGLRGAFKFALSNPDVIIGALAALFLARKVLAVFTKFGEQGFANFSKGFIGGVGRGAVTNAGLLRGVFGGAGSFAATFERNGAEAGRKLRDGLRREYQAINRDLQRLGQTIPNILPKGGITTDAVKAANDRLNEVRQTIGLARTEGALFTARLTEGIRGVGNIAGGFARILGTDVRGGFQQAQIGASQFRIAVRDAFADARAAGVGAGQIVGSGVLAGFGAAISGNLAGSSTSGAGQAIGLAGILAAALSVSSIPGVGLPLAGLTLALGGLFTVLGRNESTTDRAAEKMQKYADALKNAETNAEALKNVGSVLEDTLAGESQAVQDILAATAFSFETFTDQVLAGTASARETAREFFRSLGADGVDALQALADNPGLDTFAEIRDELLRSQSFSGGIFSGLEKLGVDLDDVADAFDFLNDEADAILGGSQGNESINRFRTSVRLVGIDLNDTGRGADFMARRVAALEAPVTQITATADRMEAAIQGADDSFRTFAEAETIRRIDEARAGMDALNTALDELNRKRTDALNAQIEEVTDKLKTAQDAATVARDAVASFFSGGDVASASSQIDDAVNDALSIGQALGEAFAKTDQLRASALADVFEQFDQRADAIAAAAFEENRNIDAAGLLQQFQPLFQGIREAAALEGDDLFTDVEAQALIDRIQGKLSDESFTSLVDLASSAQQAADDLQAELRRLNVALEIPVTFSSAQIRSELVKAGFSADQISALIPLTIIRARGEAVGENFAQGTADGFERGIEAGTFQVERAITNMATAAELAAADRLEIRSPSKVFEALGIQIPAGLAEGILAGAPGAYIALREFSVTLFQRMAALPGTLAENFASVLEEIPTGINSITDSIDGFVTSTFDAIAALEGLAGVDLSLLQFGESNANNPLSNTGLTADRFRDDLERRFNAGATPILTGPSVDVNRPEAVVAAAAAAVATTAASKEVAPRVNIEHMDFYETTNARATAREAVKSLTVAALGR